jgi:hypothetical protein
LNVGPKLLATTSEWCHVAEVFTYWQGHTAPPELFIAQLIMDLLVLLLTILALLAALMVMLLLALQGHRFKHLFVRVKGEVFLAKSRVLLLSLVVIAKGTLVKVIGMLSVVRTDDVGSDSQGLLVLISVAVDAQNLLLWLSKLLLLR